MSGIELLLAIVCGYFLGHVVGYYRGYDHSRKDMERIIYAIEEGSNRKDAEKLYVDLQKSSGDSSGEKPA
jgi:hypothetical protein